MPGLRETSEAIPEISRGANNKARLNLVCFKNNRKRLLCRQRPACRSSLALPDPLEKLVPSALQGIAQADQDLQRRAVHSRFDVLKIAHAYVHLFRDFFLGEPGTFPEPGNVSGQVLLMSFV